MVLTILKKQYDLRIASQSARSALLLALQQTQRFLSCNFCDLDFSIKKFSQICDIMHV